MSPELKGHIGYLLEAELQRRQKDLQQMLQDGEPQEVIKDYEEDVSFSQSALTEWRRVKGAA